MEVWQECPMYLLFIKLLLLLKYYIQKCRYSNFYEVVDAVNVKKSDFLNLRTGVPLPLDGVSYQSGRSVGPSRGSLNVIFSSSYLGPMQAECFVCSGGPHPSTKKRITSGLKTYWLCFLFTPSRLPCFLFALLVGCSTVFLPFDVGRSHLGDLFFSCRCSSFFFVVILVNVNLRYWIVNFSFNFCCFQTSTQYLVNIVWFLKLFYKCLKNISCRQLIHSEPTFSLKKILTTTDLYLFTNMDCITWIAIFKCFWYINESGRFPISCCVFGAMRKLKKVNLRKFQPMRAKQKP